MSRRSAPRGRGCGSWSGARTILIDLDDTLVPDHAGRRLAGGELFSDQRDQLGLSMREALLLYQTGAAHGSPVEAARQLFAGRVDVWIEARAHGLLGMEGLAGILERAPRSGLERRLGMVFGDSSTLLRSMEDPLGLLESETTWERDVADACKHALGVAPAANVCVYREADLQELAIRLDPLAAALSLVQAHPHVAVQEPGGRVTTGPAAVERILTAVRPAGISSETWESLSRAAAAGLAHA